MCFEKRLYIRKISKTYNFKYKLYYFMCCNCLSRELYEYISSGSIQKRSVYLTVYTPIFKFNEFCFQKIFHNFDNK